MPSTAHGWPYPDGTAKIGQIHTKIQDLAAALERRLQGGSIAFPSANGAGTIAVVFPVPFTNVPSLAFSHNGPNVTALYHQSLTNLGFSCLINRSAISSPNVKWIAFDFTS
jgi:hypothetical protein